ncbi:hypothetical protein GCM10020254_37070 [Streptomyces goshikiensis]
MPFGTANPCQAYCVGGNWNEASTSSVAPVHTSRVRRAIAVLSTKVPARIRPSEATYSRGRPPHRWVAGSIPARNASSRTGSKAAARVGCAAPLERNAGRRRGRVSAMPVAAAPAARPRARSRSRPVISRVSSRITSSRQAAVVAIIAV